MIPTEGSTGPLVKAVGIAFGLLTFFVLSTRLFARFYVVKVIGLDDILIVFAALLSYAFIIATILAVDHGLGSHIETIPLTEFPTYLHIVWLSSVFYNACLGFIKTSVLALYMRLGEPRLRRRAMFMAAVVCCQASANVLTCLFQCNPVKKVWDTTITTGHCINIDAFYLANAALNIFTDVLTYILPIDLVWHLQLPTRQRIGLGIMLGLGFFTCISSMIRIIYVPPLLYSSDATYEISPAMYWSVIEISIGILAASIPSFKAIFKRYLPRFLGSSQKPTPGYENNYGNLSRSTRSGFVELSERGRKIDNSAMDDISDGKNPDDTNIASGRVKVTICNTNATYASSTEELIHPPRGKILAQTQISTTVSSSADEDVPKSSISSTSIGRSV